MKRLSNRSLAFVLAVIMVVSCMATMLSVIVTAEGEDSNAKVFWLTSLGEHSNGYGTIVKTEDTAGMWNDHVAFAPIKGKANTYIIEDIVLCGTDRKLAVPEGGFVYLLNVGDAPESPARAQQMRVDIGTWAVGDVFVITGIDSLPENTAKIYEEAYICNARYTVVVYENLALKKDVQIVGGPKEGAPEVAGFGNYKAKLTDGAASGIASYDDNWFGFYANGENADNNALLSGTLDGQSGKIGTAIIDLGEKATFNQVRINAWVNNGSGILSAKKFIVSYSDDKESWTHFAEIESKQDEGVYWLATPAKESVAARYVRLQACFPGSFCMINEIEVYNKDLVVPDHSDVTLPDGIWPVFDNQPIVYVDRDSGTYQNAFVPVAPYYFVENADKDNIYFAFATTYAPIGTPEHKGNGNGTFIRMWANTDKDYTKWTHILDFSFNGTGLEIGGKATSASYTFDNSKVVYESIVTDGILFGQVKVPLSTFGTAEFVDYYVQVANGKDEEKGIAYQPLFYPKCDTLPTSAWDRAHDFTHEDRSSLLGIPEFDTIVIHDLNGYTSKLNSVLTNFSLTDSTVGDISKVIQGAAKDYNAFYVYSCDANGVVVERNIYSYNGGSPKPAESLKGGMTVLAGGYAVAIHCDNMSAEDAEKIAVGDIITLNNMDLGPVAGEVKKIDLTDASVSVFSKLASQTIDLGAETPLAGLEAYAFNGFDPASIKVYLSNDNENFVSITHANKFKVKAINKAPVVYGDDISLFILDWSTRTSLAARYVKLVVDGDIYVNDFKPVFAADDIIPHAIDKTDYIGVNVEANGESTVIYTSAAGDIPMDASATGTFKNARAGNHTYAKWDAEKKAYVITRNEVNPWPNNRAGSVKLADDEILINAVSSGALTSANGGNKWVMWQLEPGTVLYIYEDVISIGKKIDGKDSLCFIPEDDTGKVESNLVPEAEYTKVEAGGGTPTYSFADGVMTLSSDAGWPCVILAYPTPIKVNLENTDLIFDLSVGAVGCTSIILETTDGQIALVHQALGGDIDASSGDLRGGTFKGRIDLNKVLAKNGALIIADQPLKADGDGNISFKSIKLYATGGTTVTINALKLLGLPVAEPIPDLPEGATAIKTFGGYAGGDLTVLAPIGDANTLGAISAITVDATRDYNYYYFFVCDKEGKVVGTYGELGRKENPEDPIKGEKDFVAIPEGGFAIGAHADATGAEAVHNVKVGDTVTLHNVDLAALTTGGAKADLVKAGFTVEAAPEIPEDPEEPAEPAEPSFPEGAWDVFEGKDLILVNEETGSLQSATTPDVPYYLVQTSDTEFFYAAIRTTYAPIGTPDSNGNGNGTNLRLWFHTDSEAEIWTHLVDVAYDGDNEPIVSGKGQADAYKFTADGIVAEAIAVDGVLFMQVKVPLTAVNAAGDFGSYITLSNGTDGGDVVNNALYYPKCDSFTWKAWDAENEIKVAYTPAVVKEPIQPETLEDLPEGAVVINSFGEFKADIVTIYTLMGDAKTLGEAAGITTGAVKDYTWWAFIVVDKDNKVVAVAANGTDKTNLEIPEGGYAIGGHGACTSSIAAIEVGSEIQLYNILLDGLKANAETAQLEKAGFTAKAAPADPEDPEEPSSEEPSSEEPSSEEPSSEEPSEDPTTTPTEPEEKGFDFQAVASDVKVNGVIGGEDIVIATTTEAALACNANWAVRVLLKKTENANRYEVVSVAAGDGSPFAGELGADEILLVVHSDGVGSNKEGKAAALELAAGKLIHIEGLADGTITGLYAVVDEVPGPVTGDRGMVAFAIVSVIALAGAVVVKKRS